MKTTKEKIEVLEKAVEILYESDRKSERAESVQEEINELYESMIPQTLKEHIEAEYVDYNVVMLDDQTGYLSIELSQGHRVVHTGAQSMKGFYKYVYPEDGGFTGFYTCREPTDSIDDVTVFPIAVLFSKAKS